MCDILHVHGTGHVSYMCVLTPRHVLTPHVHVLPTKPPKPPVPRTEPTESWKSSSGSDRLGVVQNEVLVHEKYLSSRILSGQGGTEGPQWGKNSG